MTHPAGHRRFYQAAALGAVVVIIFERIGDRFRHDDRTGKMHDRADIFRLDDPREQSAVLDIACMKGNTLRHRPAKAGGQIVDHRYRPACIAQRKHRVAANIAGPAGDQDRERFRHGSLKPFHFQHRPFGAPLSPIG